MKKLGVSAVLLLFLLLWGTFLSAEGLKGSQSKSFDWTKLLEKAKDGYQKFKKYYTFYEYAMYALDMFLGEKCPFKCPAAGQKPFPRPGHNPSSNGCGSQGFGTNWAPIFIYPHKSYLAKITDAIPVIHDCCDQHDRCYDTCGQRKRDCDGQFRSCLTNICQNILAVVSDTVQECELVMSLPVNTVMLQGCESYLASQNNACDCRFDKSDL